MEEKKKTCGGVSAVQNIQGLEMLKQRAHTCREVQVFFFPWYILHISHLVQSGQALLIMESENQGMIESVIES